MVLDMTSLPVALLLTLPLVAQTPERSAAAVAAAERAFAAKAAQEGTRAAFLATLTPEAVVFSPQAENGHAAQRAKAEDGSALRWEPEHVVLAASGDFALSSGPWSWTPKGGATPEVHGHFLSLWVLREGRWRVQLDVGVPHPVQGREPLTLVDLPGAPDPGAGERLGVAWQDFDARAARDTFGALGAYGAKDLRTYRPGLEVRPGNLPPAPRPFVPGIWREGGRAVATSADLALRWGTREAPSHTASVVQVWRRDSAGWRVALDVELPLPARKP